MTKEHPRGNREAMAEADLCMAEGNFGVQFVGEDDVLDFISELDAIIEVQEDFDTAGDKVL